MTDFLVRAFGLPCLAGAPRFYRVWPGYMGSHDVMVDAGHSHDRFKPGAFFVSSIILRAKHELTSKAASKGVLLRLLQVGPAIIAKEC